MFTSPRHQFDLSQSTHAELRHGAYDRDHLVLTDASVVGHAREISDSVLLDGAKAPHFASVGRSVLDRNANLGACAERDKFREGPLKTYSG